MHFVEEISWQLCSRNGGSRQDITFSNEGGWLIRIRKGQINSLRISRLLMRT